ncbi:prephenate dehydrogenase [Clostridium sp. YIM B02551]|uniref:prephenate dehydrogenase n=1 Tax=Clostridium sp. YIM B02551 TaxID=2910679 RepID=UPI001EEBCB26|nr:prephenate dehydrogenase [Clostridium sp. YIM B02551]
MIITIVGLGVIGGSFAMALNELQEHEIYGVDVNKETIDKAKKLGIIKDGCTSGSDFIRRSDLVIIGLYPSAILNFLKENQGNFKRGTIITDVTGIKETFINEALGIIPKEVDFIFGHPMAGREKKGIDFASKEVFKGANYLLTPHNKNKEENLSKIESLVLKIGFSRVRRITPREHDKIISFTSQLPHAIAVALINSDKEEFDTGAFIGDSYRDLTRIANINEGLWSELFLGNKDNLLQSIQSFQDQLNSIKDAIINEDRESLTKLFKESGIRREKL